MEALGATLGGGALKLEATHLRQLPIPILSDSQKDSISLLAREGIDALPSSNSFKTYRAKIDQVVMSALSQRKLSNAEAKSSVARLSEIVESLRAKRRNKTSIKSKGAQ